MEKELTLTIEKISTEVNDRQETRTNEEITMFQDNEKFVSLVNTQKVWKDITKIYNKSSASEAKIQYRLTHIKRVTTMAMEMANVLGGDPVVVYVSAILHDIAKFISNKDHALLGACMSSFYCTTYGLDSKQMTQVYNCVRNHNDKNISEEDAKKLSIEEKIIREADTLDKFSVTRFIPFEPEAEYKNYIATLYTTYNKCKNMVTTDIGKTILMDRMTEINSLKEIVGTDRKIVLKKIKK